MSVDQKIVDQHVEDATDRLLGKTIDALAAAGLDPSLCAVMQRLTEHFGRQLITSARVLGVSHEDRFKFCNIFIDNMRSVLAFSEQAEATFGTDQLVHAAEKIIAENP